MTTRRTLVLVALVMALALMVLAWPRLRLFIEVDSCLDAGGRWNDERAKCEHSGSPNHSP